MKKMVHLLLTFVLLVQFIIPQLAIAQTLATNEATLVDANLTPESQKEAASLKLTIDAQATSVLEKTIHISSSLTTENTGQQSLVDSQNQTVGTYQISNNQLTITIQSAINSSIVLTVPVKMTAGTSETQAVVSMDSFQKTVVFPDSWQKNTEASSQNEPTSSTSEGTTVTQEPAVDEGITPYREAVNIEDLYSQLGIEDNFLTSMNLTFKDAEGNTVTEPTIDDLITFGFTFELNEDVRAMMQGGDYYTFSMPDSIKVTQNQTYPLFDNNGIEYAQVEIKTDGTITITFTDEIENASDIKGDFQFSGEFDRDNIDGPGNVGIIPPGHEDIGVTVPIKPNYSGDNIDKKGYFDKELNPDKITWEVNINKALDTLENAKVTENFPEGTTYESIEVYVVEVDFDGNIVEGSETLADPSTYTVDANGNVTFNEPINQAYKLVYTTTIDQDAKPDAGGLVSFVNNAVLSADDLEDASTEASVSAKYGSEINKSRGQYDSATQTINWKLQYNYGEKTITNGYITDTFQNENMFLVDDSVKLYEVTFDEKGNAIRGRELVEGVDYTLDTSAGNGFHIEFLNDVTTAVDVEYKTGYDGIIDENTTVENAVITESGENSGGSGTLKPQNVVKNLGSVDYTNKTVNWTIEVNRNNYSMNNWSLTDKLSTGLTLLPETLVIRDNNTGQNLVLNQDYTLDYDEEANQFKIVFIGEYVKTDHSFRITYTTAFDSEAIEGEDKDKIFINDAIVNWTTDDGETITNEDKQTFEPNEPTKYNGSKSGNYNPLTKAITWTIALNYDEKGMQNAQLVDPIPQDQQYGPNSLKIYHYTIGSNGSIIRGDELTEEEYDELTIDYPFPGNGQTLTIDFPDSDSGKYLVEFETGLNGEQINSTYENDAIFKNNNFEDHTLHAEVTVNNGGQYIGKSGFQDENGFVNWSVTINASQSTLYDVMIVDEPSTNQSIDLESLHIFGTVIDANGNVAVDRNNELVKDQDYTVSLETDNVTGQQQMVIHLIGDYLVIQEPLIMEYKSMVFLEGNTGTVSNNVHISSEGNTEIDDNNSDDLEVSISEGGGSSSGIRGQIILQKADANGNVLPEGATFELWDKNNTQVLRSGTVDGDGLITFGSLPYGTYLLKETGALNEQGYTIPQELVDGKQIEINESTTQGVPIVIKNELGKVELLKQNEQGNALAGAEFKLEMYDTETESWLEKEVDQSLVTNQAGKLIIEGLSPGKYRLTETKAPDGYILNTNTTEFEVTVNEDHQLIQVGMDTPFVNYQAGISFIKKDQQGNPLAGAEFGLYAKGNEETAVAKAISGADGKVTFTNVGPGTYVIKEISSPNGYLLNKEVLGDVVVPEEASEPVGTIEVDRDFINYKGAAEITKYGETSEGRSTLSGVEFALETEDGTVVDTGTTDENGKWLAENLAPGTYYFRETSVGPNSDYLLNTERVKVVIEPNTVGQPETIQAELVDYKGAFQVKKVNNEGTGLAGAVFDLYTASKDLVASGLTSDENGMITYEDLAPGRYYLVETQAPLDENGVEYVKNEYPIWITVNGSAAGKPAVIELGQFQNYKGKISLTKVGAGNLPIEGAKFALYIANGEDEDLVKELVAGKDGVINIDDLGPGYYKLVEIEAPPGYVINKQPIYFTVREGEENEPPVEDVSIVNYEISIVAHKVSDAVPVPEALSGAVFSIFEASDVDHENPITVYDRNDEPTQELMADENGEIYAEGLEAGTYVLVEVEAPNGYILNTDPVEFTIEPSIGEPEHINLDLGNIVNYHGSIEIQKKNETDELLSGGKFEIHDAEGNIVKVTDGLGLPNVTQLTSMNGVIKATDLAPGNYYLVEVEAPDGYILEANQRVLPFEIESDSEGTTEITFKGTLTNYQGEVQLHKTAKETNESLAGAVFNLYKSSGTLVKENLTTNDRGLLTVNQLEPGDYYFEEQKAPTGYQLTQEKVTFTIDSSSNGKPKEISVTVANQQIPEKPETPSSPNTPSNTKKPTGILSSLGEKAGTALIGLGILLLGGVLIILFYKKRKKQE